MSICLGLLWLFTISRLMSLNDHKLCDSQYVYTSLIEINTLKFVSVIAKDNEKLNERVFVYGTIHMLQSNRDSKFYCPMEYKSSANTHKSQVCNDSKALPTTFRLA